MGPKIIQVFVNGLEGRTTTINIEEVHFQLNILFCSQSTQTNLEMPTNFIHFVHSMLTGEETLLKLPDVILVPRVLFSRAEWLTSHM